MKKIESFKVNHDILKKGMYISRTDGDVVTYDIRMKEPNKGDYLDCCEMHTLEHLIATYVRNTEYSDDIVYVGPMGCRTGFYLLTRNKISSEEAINLMKNTFDFVIGFNGEIPGSKRIECGNYKEHNIAGAKIVAKDMKKVLENWTAEKLKYEET